MNKLALHVATHSPYNMSRASERPGFPVRCRRRAPLKDEWQHTSSMHYVSGKESAMLVLSRHLDEKIVIPGLGITIKVVAIKGNTVRLGIDAPQDMTNFREEIAPEF